MHTSANRIPLKGGAIVSKSLSDAEINAQLASLLDWERVDDRLVKTFYFDSYLEGLAFASAIGVIAESQDHHPDLYIGWRRMEVAFTTHDAGNTLTAKDFAAAAAIDGLGYPA